MRSLVLLCVLCVSVVKAQSFNARHDHAKGNCQGQLSVDAQGIRFESQKKEHSRTWKFTDIQELRLEPDGMRVLTYEDRRWFGADRDFEFSFPEAKDAWRQLRGVLAGPLERRLVVAFADPPEAPLYTFPAKHRHGRGGCQGVIVFGPETISYASREPDHSRTWTYKDLESIASSGPYQLILNTYEHERFHYGDRRAFDFQLQEPINEEAFNVLWRKINPSRLSRMADEAVERILSATAAPPPVPISPPEAPDLPGILQAVAHVESRGNPLALSPKGARGIYQLMPDTARHYGLRVGPGLDERTDPVKSRQAAAQYLGDLMARFGDWKLALAGYNAGEGRVQRVLERAGPAWLEHLPEETRRYVPAVLAATPAPAPAVAGLPWFALTGLR